MTMNEMFSIHQIKKSILSAAVIVVLSTGVLFAQNGASLGLGGASTAIARGVEAVFWNPANLAFLPPDSLNHEIRLWSLSFGAGNNSLSMDLIDEFGSKHLTEGDKDKILAEISDDAGLKINLKVDANILAVRYRNVVVGFEAMALGEGSIPKTLFENVFRGLERRKYEYDTDGFGVGIGRFSASYGRIVARNRKIVLPRNYGNIVITRMAVGVTASYIYGGGYARIEESRIIVENTPQGLNADIHILTRTSEGGSGIGFDLGFAAETQSGWQFGFAIDNVLGRVSWSDNNKEKTETIQFDDLFLGDFGDLEEEDYHTSEDRPIGNFSYDLPRDSRIAVAKRFSKYYLGNVELAREFGHMRFTLGGGVLLRYFQFYAAYGRHEGDNYFSGAIIFNFKYFVMDFGVRNRNGLTARSSKEISFANSIRFAF